MIYFVAYLVILGLCLMGNKRWGDHIAAYDADMDASTHRGRSRVWHDV